MERILFALRRFGDGLNTVCRIVLGITSLALCVAVIGQFLLRWVGVSLPWATEFSCYTFVWTTMAGSALASRHLMHIGVNILTNALKGNVQKTVLIIANIILIIALLLFTVASGNYTIQQIPHKGTTINVSLAIFYVSLPLAGLVMIYYTIVQTVEIAIYGQAVKIPLPGDEDAEGENVNG